MVDNRAVRRGVALASLAAFLPGCFNYVPVELAAAPEGEDVRIYLTRQGLADLTEIPLEDGPLVTGTLVSRQDDRLLVRIPVTTRQEGFHTTRLGQDVAIPAESIVQIERRELNRGGTALLVAGAAGAAAAVVFLIIDGGSGNPDDDPGGGDEARVRLFSIPVR